MAEFTRSPCTASGFIVGGGGRTGAGDGLEVYRHTVAGCINPWVAGGGANLRGGLDRVEQPSGG
jgi:hypothetical protein